MRNRLRGILQVGDEVVSRINFETSDGKVSVGDVGHVNGPCNNAHLSEADRRVHCRFPHLSDVNMLVPEHVFKKGAVLPGGLQVGDEVVSRMDFKSNEGKISAGDIGIVKGPCDNIKASEPDRRVNCQFPHLRNVNQLVPEHVVKKGTILPDAFWVGDKVVSRMDFKKNDRNVSLGDIRFARGLCNNAQISEPNKRLNCQFQHPPSMNQLVSEHMFKNNFLPGGFRVGDELVPGMDFESNFRKAFNNMCQMGIVKGPCGNAKSSEPDRVNCQSPHLVNKSQLIQGHMFEKGAALSDKGDDDASLSDFMNDEGKVLDPSIIGKRMVELKQELKQAQIAQQSEGSAILLLRSCLENMKKALREKGEKASNLSSCFCVPFWRARPPHSKDLHKAVEDMEKIAEQFERSSKTWKQKLEYSEKMVGHIRNEVEQLQTLVRNRTKKAKDLEHCMEKREEDIELLQTSANDWKKRVEELEQAAKNGDEEIRKLKDEILTQTSEKVRLIEFWKGPWKQLESKSSIEPDVVAENVHAFVLSCSHQGQLRNGIHNKCFPFQGLHNLTVHSVHNPSLFHRFQDCKAAMKARHCKLGIVPKLLSPSLKLASRCPPLNAIRCDEDLNEMLLFHGCPKDAAANILENGFDVRFSSRGNLYGEGLYFSKQPCKTHQYVRSSGTCHILVARVLLGDPAYPKDKCEGKLPPLRDSSDKSKGHFDSNVVDPALSQRGQDHYEYVVFDKDQAYPEFLITYQI